MGNHSDNSWPPYGDGFRDEYGGIEPEVYATAAAIWPKAEALAHTQLGDSAAGRTLLMKAAARVSQQFLTRRQRVDNLKAYLFQSYKHLILAELRKARLHDSLNVEALRAAERLSKSPAEELDKRILIEQLMLRMDPWSRRVFEALVLGFSFDEIGREVGMRGASVRNRFNKNIKSLIRRFNEEDSR